MNKLILALSFLLLYSGAQAQRFSHYNTGTLYDSFENPSQGIFVADTTRTIAFNFLVPNFHTNAYIKGNAQGTLKSRLFLNEYNGEALQIGQAKQNNVLFNANAYTVMFRILSSQNGDQELGFSMQTKFNGRGMITDESLALPDRNSNFEDDRYTNIFNDNGYYEGFHQISLTYREKATKDFSVGVKLSALLGIVYNRFNITQSAVTFNRPQDYADLYLRGNYRSTFIPFDFEGDDIWPTFKHPGAAISIGATYRAPGNIVIQGNIKDLGFIHWTGDETRTYDFGMNNEIARIQNISTNSRQKNTINALSRLISRYPEQQSFTTPIEGRAEVAVSKKFAVNDKFSYTPTGIASKTLFHAGSTLAMVNHIQYGNFVLTATGAYSDYNQIFNLGGQLMFKAPNVEFYLGSDQLSQTTNVYSSAQKNRSAINKNMPYSGADFYLGFSVKFGRWFERWMNSSYIPTGGEQGPLGRFWTRLFNSN